MVETDIIASIAASPTRRAVILVIMYVEKYERGLIKGIIQRKHSWSEIYEVVCNKLTNIGGKACNNIPKAVDRLALSARWAIFVKHGGRNMISHISLNKTQSFIIE